MSDISPTEEILCMLVVHKILNLFELFKLRNKHICFIVDFLYKNKQEYYAEITLSKEQEPK